MGFTKGIYLQTWRISKYNFDKKKDNQAIFFQTFHETAFQSWHYIETEVGSFTWPWFADCPSCVGNNIQVSHPLGIRTLYRSCRFVLIFHKLSCKNKPLNNKGWIEYMLLWLISGAGDLLWLKENILHVSVMSNISSEIIR